MNLLLNFNITTHQQVLPLGFSLSDFRYQLSSDCPFFLCLGPQPFPISVVVCLAYLLQTASNLTCLLFQCGACIPRNSQLLCHGCAWLLFRLYCASFVIFTIFLYFNCYFCSALLSCLPPCKNIVVFFVSPQENALILSQRFANKLFYCIISVVCF